MNLTIAGNKKVFEDGLTITKLLEIEKVETPQYVTVSINDEFIESRNFKKTVLHDGDTIEFLYFMGGGR